MKGKFIMKNLFKEHPWAATVTSCSMAFAGVLGLKIATDFAFNMTVLFVEKKRKKDNSGAE